MNQTDKPKKRRKVSFLQADAARALRAVASAGVDARVEIDPSTGKIVIIPGKPNSEPTSSEEIVL